MHAPGRIVGHRPAKKNPVGGFTRAEMENGEEIGKHQSSLAQNGKKFLRIQLAAQPLAASQWHALGANALTVRSRKRPFAGPVVGGFLRHIPQPPTRVASAGKTTSSHQAVWPADFSNSSDFEVWLEFSG